MAPIVCVVRPATSGGLRRTLQGATAGWGAELAIVENAQAEQGIASSLVAGIRALPEAATGVLVVPGDMPALTGEVVSRLLDRFAAHGGEAIVHAALADGSQRNPVIWPRRLFADLARLQGDVGGKPLIARERQRDAHAVAAVQVADDGHLLDVDTPQELAAFNCDAPVTGPGRVPPRE